MGAVGSVCCGSEGTNVRAAGATLESALMAESACLESSVEDFIRTRTWSRPSPAKLSQGLVRMHHVTCLSR